MKYKNTKTGAVIDTFGEIAGADWKKVVPVSNESEEQTFEMQDTEKKSDSVAEKPPAAQKTGTKKK